MKRTMKLASRSKRFAAGCIDMALPTIAYVFMRTVIGIPLSGTPSPDIANRLTPATSAIVLILTLLMIAYLVLEFVFYARAQSIGKIILGLQVISSIDGKPFTFWKMIFRELIVKNAIGSFLLGYLWILIDDKNRGWHDKILDSYVVDIKESAQLMQTDQYGMQSAQQTYQQYPPAQEMPDSEYKEGEDSETQ